MPATIDADEHRFNYVSGHNPQTRLNSMGGEGPAWIDPKHWLAEVGKDFLPAPVQGRIVISYHFLEWIFLDLLLLMQAAMDLGQGWFLSYPLLSQVMAELCFVKIPNVPMSKPQIRETITSWGKANLSIAQRTVPHIMIIQSPITSIDWHSAATNKMVAGPAGAPGPDQDNSKLRHFRMLMGGGYNTADQASPEFNGLVDLFELAIGKDLTNKSPAAVCAHACSWHRQVCPLAEFDDYVSHSDAAGELAALAPGGNNAAIDIYKHRFIRAWRRVYPNVSTAFSTAISGEEAYHLSETLAAKFKLSTPLSAASSAALELMLGKILPAVDTDALKLKSNSERLAALSEGDLDGATARSAGGGSGPNSAGGDNVHRMFTDPKYMKLQSAIESLALPGYDVISAFKTISMDIHPFGIIFVNGKKMPNHPVWCFFSGLQSETVAREVLLSMLRVDKLGVEHKDWVLDVHPDVAKKLLQGRFAMGDGKTGSIHYYSQIIRPCLEKREGHHILARYAAYSNLDSTAIFLEPQLMRFAEQIIGTCFDFIGHTGKTALTVRALWRGLIERSQVLETMPSSVPVVKSLRFKLMEVGTHAFASAAEDMQALCTTALGVLVRPSGFFRDNSKGSIALASYDLLVKETLSDLERAQLGMGRIPGMPGSSGLVNQLMLDYDGTGSKAPSTDLNINLKRPFSEVQTSSWGDSFDPSKNGDQAAYHGVYLSDTGYTFGWHSVGLTEGKTLNITGICPGRLALSKHGKKRAGWHVAGYNCTEDHPRPKGVTEDDIIELTSNTNPITAELRNKMKVIVAPSADNRSHPSGAGKGGGGGKGDKGKGQKGGKSSNGGKGKGKGGKGGKHLNQRQRI